MGHENPATTAGYAKISTADAVDSVRRLAVGLQPATRSERRYT
jgi:hypothetical protein